MKTTLWKKCLLVFGMFLLLAVISPSVLGNTAVASASTVTDEQSNIKLNVKSKSLVKDTTFNLKLYNITENQKVSYKSGDSSIASVDDTGLITAVDYGTAIITVTVKDSLKPAVTLECEITVGPPALSIKLTKTEITLVIGDKTSLTAILKPNNTVEEARFCSNDSNIATVSIGGRISAKSAGVTYIFASIGNGKYDYCKVTVVEKLEATPTPTESVQQ